MLVYRQFDLAICLQHVSIDFISSIFQSVKNLSPSTIDVGEGRIDDTKLFELEEESADKIIKTLNIQYFKLF